MNSVEELDVFKLAHELALKICSVTKSFPSELRTGYDRVAQMLSRLSQSLGSEPRAR